MTYVCVVYKLCMPSARGGQQRVWGPLELDDRWLHTALGRCSTRAQVPLAAKLHLEPLVSFFSAN